LEISGNEQAIEWISAKPGVKLPVGYVHIWRFPLTLAQDEQDDAFSWLARDERERMRNRRDRGERARFLAAHAAMRAILGGYLDVHPKTLQFAFEPHGRPFLTQPMGAERLRFNLSHARGLGLLACAWERQVGVDIEDTRRRIDPLITAHEFFSPIEQEELNGLPQPERVLALFNAWTRKEAYLKGRGAGITRPLSRYSVSLAPGKPAQLLADDTDPDAPQGWSLRALFPGSGYAAALSVEGAGWTLESFDYKSK
jgi:4'-phosphopantetheinyl transferase